MGERTAVLQHVTDTGGAAQIVLEDGEHSLLVADQVDPCDVDTHAVGRLDPPRGAMEVTGTGDQPPRDDAIVEHRPGTVHIGQEHLQSPDALGHPLFDHPPLRSAEQAWHEVQRQRTFPPRQAERDALPVEVRVDEPTAVGETFLPEPEQDRLQRIDRVDVCEVAVHLLIRGEDGVE